MLKEILAALKGHNEMTESIDLFNKMFENNLWMFQSSLESINKPQQQVDVKQEVYSRDIQVNKAERSIRKKIVLHLSANNIKDTPFCLILMNAVKDAERIGDYCKNLFQASELFNNLETEDVFLKEIKNIGTMIVGTFKKTQKAFDESDIELGKDAMNEERNIGSRCDLFLSKLANYDDSLTTNQAVCYTLFVRFLKRISAHLGNIASTVVMPLHKIDYFDEPRKK